MILATVQYIWELLSEMIKSILQLDTIFWVGGGFFALMTLFIFIKSSLSYERKLTKSVNKLNNWLLKNRTINEQNLVEFNNMIKSKKCPKILRKHWQQYMLYRDKMPSEYISTYNCIEKPSKTSNFATNIKNYVSIYKITALITFFFSLISFSGKSDSSIIYYVSMTLVTPAIIMLFGVIITLILRLMQNHNIADLYQTFHIFTRYLDKASATIPKYVDFEILFTQREIKDGIPILGEYLEKRARQEQEELEEAQRNAVAHEEYNFAESGVDGSLMLERAMKESETYLNAKQRIYAEIQQFESEISTLQKNYENTSKDHQRKLQASKENMERLRQQQEESTNRIEINYIRKQQQDEVKKQEQLEHDQEESTNKFNSEISSLNEEIAKRKQDLEAKRLKVQEAMESEFQTFSVKLHKAVSSDVEKENDVNIQRINSEKEQYAQAITYLKGEVDNKDQIILAKDQLIAELTNRLELLAKGEIQVQDELKQESPEQQEEIQPNQEQDSNVSTDDSQDGHYDDNGYYWFNDGTYYDPQGLYHDLQGNVYDSEGNLKATNVAVESETKQSQEEQVNNDEQIVEPLQENNTTEEVVETIENHPNEEEQSPTENIEELSIEENEELIEEQNIKDAQPVEKVNLESETSDTETEPNETSIDEQTIEENQEPQIQETTEETTTSVQNEQIESAENNDEAQDQSQVGYDDQGNYRYKNGTYYDSNNLYHDLDGNIYDTEGKLVEEKSIVEQESQIDSEDNQQEAESVEESEIEVSLNEENNPESEIQEIEEQLIQLEESTDEQPIEDINIESEAPAVETEIIESDDTSITEQPVQENEKQSAKESEEQQQPLEESNDNDSETSENAETSNKNDINPEDKQQEKRKVGRPRKEVSEEELNKPKRSVGRPRKEVSEEELNKPKRSVGRPRKEVSEEELNKPKRRVGRPKKENKDTENKPKRRAGRPKKEETEEQSTEILKHLGQSLLDLSEQKSKKKNSSKKSEE